MLGFLEPVQGQDQLGHRVGLDVFTHNHQGPLPVRGNVESAGRGHYDAPPKVKQGARLADRKTVARSDIKPIVVSIQGLKGEEEREPRVSGRTRGRRRIAERGSAQISGDTTQAEYEALNITRRIEVSGAQHIRWQARLRLPAGSPKFALKSVRLVEIEYHPDRRIVAKHSSSEHLLFEAMVLAPERRPEEIRTPVSNP